MLSPDEYPVYNHKERPGIGKDLSGNLFYNCFSVKLPRESETEYRTFLFSDFLRQYNEYSEYSDTCSSCITRHKAYTYPVDQSTVDRTSVDRKFNNGDADPAIYYYCPLIGQVLSASRLTAEVAQMSSKIGNLSAKPIQAILSGSWDDEYLMSFDRIAAPQDPRVCAIVQDLLSDKFISTPAERSFFLLWFFAMFREMEAMREMGQKVYWEDADFDWRTSRIFRFVFPIPQVWLHIIPKPPPGVDWQIWEEQHRRESIPQRADFLVIHNKKRVVIEIDDINHYGIWSKGTWIASERRYRQTLADTRWFKVNGFDVLRFTNEEILGLYNPSTSNKPDIKGFAKLLRTAFLEPKQMVLL